MMCGIAIGVDGGGGGGDEQRWHNAQQNSRVAVTRQGDGGKSIFSIIMREIFHLLQEFIE